jgi:hypothetical protein
VHLVGFIIKKLDVRYLRHITKIFRTLKNAEVAVPNCGGKSAVALPLSSCFGHHDTKTPASAPLVSYPTARPAYLPNSLPFFPD